MTHRSFLALSALALWVGSGVAHAGIIHVVTIDDFVTPTSPTPVSVTTASLPAFAYGSTAAAATAIGGTRGVTVQKTFGNNGEAVKAQVNPFGNEWFRMNLDNARGSVLIQYDGDTAQAINYSGLSGVDLTGGYDLDQLFYQMEVDFSDHLGPLTITAYKNGSSTIFASATVNVPIVGVPFILSIPLSAFLPTGDTLSNILTDVGAMTAFLDARPLALAGWDLQLANMEIIVVPEPETFALFCLGLVGLALNHLRSRSGNRSRKPLA